MSEWFHRIEYLKTAEKLHHAPPDRGVEIVFAGRSNAGKSSAINTLAGQRGLARTSKTPGRTRELIYFDCGEGQRIVDLPGYGYAKVGAAIQARWHKVLEQYFTHRKSLAGLVLIMDVRRPLTELDQQMFDWCCQSGIPVHALLTKSDKLSKGAAKSVLHKVQAILQEVECEATAQLFSALKKTGVDEARVHITGWLEQKHQAKKGSGFKGGGRTGA